MCAVKLSFLCALLSFTMTAAPSAQDSTRVSIPDTAGYQGDSVAIPVVVGDVTGQNVISYQATITFDPTVLGYVGCSSTGTISEPWGSPFCAEPIAGQVNVGGFGTSALSDSGDLVNLEFDVVGSPCDSSFLHFQYFLFNAGEPQAHPLTDGKFKVLCNGERILTVTPESWDYDSVIVGQSVDKVFELRNDGTGPFDVTRLSVAGGDGDFSLVCPPSTPFTLDSAETENVIVRFSPSSVEEKKGTFTIENKSDNASPSKDIFLKGTGKSGVEDGPSCSLMPLRYSLSQNYPNPFNEITQIKYASPRECYVRLEVYTILGQKVANLVDGKQKVGYKTTRWDASSFSSGIYFYRLQAGDFAETRKMILLK